MRAPERRRRPATGSWLGGLYGADSFVSSYPEAREIFIQEAWSIMPDGSFNGKQRQTIGMYVRCEDVRSIEFMSIGP